jgi:formylglycine-generating enzyme required for sulfatase activity
VGRFRPNPFELHDMCGNVMEWCRNAYDAGNFDPALEPSSARSPAVRDSSYQFGAFLAR